MPANGYAGSASFMVLELTLQGGLIFFRWDGCLMGYAGGVTKSRLNTHRSGWLSGSDRHISCRKANEWRLCLWHDKMDLLAEKRQDFSCFADVSEK